MIAKKTFIILMLVFSFVVCVSAQEQTPKIIWENMQKEYENFENIKPVIKLENAKYILWNYNYPKNNLLLRFSEKDKEWIEGNQILNCGFIPRHKNLILKENESLDFFFYSGEFFDFESKKGYFFTSSNREKYSVKRKIQNTILLWH